MRGQDLIGRRARLLLYLPLLLANVQMAGAILAALPTLLVYMFLSRFFLRGLMAGALK